MRRKLSESFLEHVWERSVEEAQDWIARDKAIELVEAAGGEWEKLPAEERKRLQKVQLDALDLDDELINERARELMADRVSRAEEECDEGGV